MASLKNLTNLTQRDPAEARAIRVKGGIARQNQRRRELTLKHFIQDSFYIDTYYNNVLEALISEKKELNSIQKETIKKEFYAFLLNKGYIRELDLTKEELEALKNCIVKDRLTDAELNSYFKFRKPKKNKRNSKQDKSKE